MNAQSQKKLDEQSADSLNVLKDRLTDVSHDAARVVDDEAHKSPWRFVGIAAIVSLILGFVLGRKSKP